MKSYPKKTNSDSGDVSISNIQKNRIFRDNLQKKLREESRITKTSPIDMDVYMAEMEAREILNRWDKASQKEKTIIREMAENKEYLEKFKDEIKELKTISKTNEKSKNPQTDIKNGEGFLLFRGERISLGLSSSGKFKLAEMFCNESFGKAKTLDTVFGVVKKIKDKNKTDNRLSDNHIKYTRIVELLKGLVKEINRDIKSYVVCKKIKNFNYRLSLDAEIKQNIPKVWLREKVGRGG